MPELPEVETIRKQLADNIVGERVLRVRVRFGGRLSHSERTFRSKIEGSTIEDVDRRAKLLLFRFSSGQTMAGHLKMTGKFLMKPDAIEPSKHTHVVFEFESGREMHFEDVRKFGYLHLLPTSEMNERLDVSYGPEPLEKRFTPAVFAERLQGAGPRVLKQKLLDQACIAGVGNIYADEACWRAGVLPGRRVESLSGEELNKLHAGVVSSLRESLERGGTSSDNYRDAFGNAGKNVPNLNVYGRGGEQCKACDAKIVKVWLAGRGTHYCEECQK